MPYILPKERARFTTFLTGLNAFPTLSSGELNYLITQLINHYVGIEGNYAKMNEAIGALECAKQEIYRRRIAPYEDKKKETNGDVF